MCIILMFTHASQSHTVKTDFFWSIAGVAQATGNGQPRPVSERFEREAAKRSFAGSVKLPQEKCREALQRMRKLIALFTLSIVAGGCSGGDGQPEARPCFPKI